MRILERLLPLVLGAVCAPAGLEAFSTGPLAQRAAIPADGGLSCTACHNAARTVNPDALGRLTIETSPYRPGVKQLIRVRLTHPQAARWGFELAARFVSDEAKQAGTFRSVEGFIRVTCANDAPAPCNGDKEFATHVAASTFAGQREGAEWTVEWTPPAMDAGPVIFYAVGNAANNNSNFTGDFIYATNVKISTDGTCTVSTQPAIRGIADAASGRQAALAMNTIFTIAASGFTTAGAEGRAASSLDFVDGRFPTELGCLAVEVGGQRAPILFTNATQINAQMPSSVPPGSSTVTLILNAGKANERRSDARAVTVLANAPSFFVFNGFSIAARHPDFSIAAESALIPGARPVKPGDVVLLYATGLGPTNPVYQAGEVPGTIAATREPVTVTVAGTTLAPADVLYAGLSPGSISGLYQLNIRIPASTADGNIPVILTIGGQPTQNGTTIAVRR